MTALVIRGLHHALLVFRREHREDRRHLRHAPDPLRAAVRLSVAAVVAVPVGHGRLRVDRRAALRLRLGQQRFVVFLRRLVLVGTDDALARPVVVAVAPRCGFRRLRADALSVPHRVDLTRIVAAVVALIEPVRAVLVEVLRREHVDRQRLDTGRRPEDRRRRATSASTAGRSRRSRTATLSGRGGSRLSEDLSRNRIDRRPRSERYQHRAREHSQQPLYFHAETLLARCREWPAIIHCRATRRDPTLQVV